MPRHSLALLRVAAPAAKPSPGHRGGSGHTGCPLPPAREWLPGPRGTRPDAGPAPRAPGKLLAPSAGAGLLFPESELLPHPDGSGGEGTGTRLDLLQLEGRGWGKTHNPQKTERVPELTLMLLFFSLSVNATLGFAHGAGAVSKQTVKKGPGALAGRSGRCRSVQSQLGNSSERPRGSGGASEAAASAP